MKELRQGAATEEITLPTTILRGRVTGAFRSRVRIDDSDGRRLIILREQVARIVRLDRDSRTNGVLIGAAIGVALPIALVASTEDLTFEGDPGRAVGGLLVAGGLGAAVGAIVDGRRGPEKKTMIYQAGDGSDLIAIMPLDGIYVSVPNAGPWSTDRFRPSRVRRSSIRSPGSSSDSALMGRE